MQINIITLKKKIKFVILLTYQILKTKTPKKHSAFWEPTDPSSNEILPEQLPFTVFWHPASLGLVHIYTWLKH